VSIDKAAWRNGIASDYELAKLGKGYQEIAGSTPAVVIFLDQSSHSVKLSVLSFLPYVANNPVRRSLQT
jgi:hypothetical protein